MASTNRYPGLSKGPIDSGPRGALIQNDIAGSALEMGIVVKYGTIATSQLLPSVVLSTVASTTVRALGIIVDGANDGVYGDGGTPTDLNKAALAAGESVAVLTQGRCLAKVTGTGGVIIGQPLIAHSDGTLIKASGATQPVIAIALAAVATADIDMIAVQVIGGGPIA